MNPIVKLIIIILLEIIFVFETRTVLGEEKTDKVHENKTAPIEQYVSKPEEIAVANEKAYLYCIFGGTPLPTIIWYKNDKPIQFCNGTTSKDSGKIIEIEKVTPSDEGNYTCQANNGVGNAISHTISLKVLVEPRFTKKPEGVTIDEDETVEFHCEATGNPTPKIIWLHNGTPLSEAPFDSRRTVSVNSIIFEKLRKNDSGNYGCNATNIVGYVYQNAYVNVLAEPPNITQLPQDGEVIEGRMVMLSCRAMGSPKPRIIWFRDGTELIGDQFITTKSGDLTIRNATLTDTGKYTCLAQNKISSTNTSANLSVRQHTRIPPELAPSDTKVPAGETVTFNCSAINDPSLKLTITWLRNGGPIDFSNQHFVQNNDNSLTISKTKEMDSGNYTCRASTRLDDATAEATLIVQNVPKKPLQSTQASEVPEKNTSPDIPFKNLENVTDRASNSTSFEEDVPLEAPTNLTLVKIISSTEANISWNCVPKGALRGNFQGYKIETWPESNELKGNVTKIIIDQNYTNVKINKLTPNMKNKLRILVFNGKHDSPFSEVLEINTPEGVPEKVQCVEAKPLGSSALSLTWKPPLIPNGHLTGYRIHYQTVSGTELGPLIEHSPQIANPNTTRVKLPDLKPNTNYKIIIQATTNAGVGEQFIIEQKTQPPPSSPLIKPDFKLIPIDSENSTAVKVIWLPCGTDIDPNNCSDQSIGSEFRVNYALKDEKEFQRILEKNDDNVIIHNLQPNKEYKFIVSSVDGTSTAESSMRSFKTREIRTNPEKRVAPVQTDQVKTITDVTEEVSTTRSFTTEKSSSDLTITKVEENKNESKLLPFMWFIVLLSLILLVIVIILIVIYLKKSNERSKYNVIIEFEMEDT